VKFCGKGINTSKIKLNMVKKMMELEPKEYFEDIEWAESNYSELQKEFRNKWVAIVGKKVVAFGDSIKRIREDARKKTGVKHIPILFVESGSNILSTN